MQGFRLFRLWTFPIQKIHQTQGQLNHGVQVQALLDIPRAMVVRIAHKRGIGEHDSNVTLIPEIGVVAQTYFGEDVPHDVHL
jgi:hypothetical protein